MSNAADSSQLDGGRQAGKKQRRRGHGEGTIFEAAGRWVGMVDLGMVNGKRRRKAYYGATFEEARAKIAAAVADRDKGRALPNERLTLAAFLTDWLENSVKLTARPKTYQSYEYICRVHLIPGLGNHVLTRLTPAHVQSLLKMKSESKLSPRTVAYCRVVLRTTLNDAIEQDMYGLSRNVAALAKAPRAHRRDVQPLTPEQARAFLDVISGHRWEALFTVALALGLREGEALGLSWGDVNFEARTITVRKQLQRIDKRLQLVDPKTEKSRRTIVMPLIVTERLRAHRVRQVEERLAAGEFWQDSNLVFTSKLGTAIHPENLGRTMRPLLARAECPQQRFHDLRHACASLLLAQGATMKEVQETLGHTQLATTSEIYAHLYPEFRREVADRMDAILTSRS